MNADINNEENLPPAEPNSNQNSGNESTEKVLANSDNNNSTKEEEDIKEVPQDSELIEKIVNEANENKTNPNYIPKSANQAEFSLEKNDPRLKMTIKDGSCQFYSFLYVIFRDPSLKQKFMPKVLKSDNSYFINTKIEGEKIVFRIPLSTIADEKQKNWGNLFRCDEEYVTALGVFLHALLFMKCGFIDRLAFQPFFGTDAFFDQPIRNVGFGFTLILGNDKNEKIENSNHNENENENENSNHNENENENSNHNENENENSNHNPSENSNHNENENENSNHNPSKSSNLNSNENSTCNPSEEGGSNLDVGVNGDANHNLNESEVAVKDEAGVIGGGVVRSDVSESVSDSKILLKSETNEIELYEDGSLFIKETNERLFGHYIISISIFPQNFKFGHCLFIFFNQEEKQWKLYNSCSHDSFGEYGEMPLDKLTKTFFNGSCIVIGVPNDALEINSRLL